MKCAALLIVVHAAALVQLGSSWSARGFVPGARRPLPSRRRAPGETRRWAERADGEAVDEGGEVEEPGEEHWLKLYNAKNAAQRQAAAGKAPGQLQLVQPSAASWTVAVGDSADGDGGAAEALAGAEAPEGAPARGRIAVVSLSLPLAGFGAEDLAPLASHLSAKRIALGVVSRGGTPVPKAAAEGLAFLVDAKGGAPANVPLLEGMQELGWVPAGPLDDELVSTATGNTSWVHFGTDFLGDIVAAKDLRLRTVWVREARELSEAERQRREDERGALRDRIAEEVEAQWAGEGRVEGAEGGRIRLAMMSETYLRDMLLEDFANHVLPDALDADGDGADDDFDTLAAILSLLDALDADAQAADAPQSAAAPAAADGKNAGVPGAPAAAAAAGGAGAPTKFCIECGTVIPRRAKFCSECGALQ